MPVIFNEPLSFLQRLAEYMEHTFLVHQANTRSDSVERMKVGKRLADGWDPPKLQRLMCLSLVRSVWLPLRCRLWPPSGSVQVNPSTHYWEKPMNWSGMWDFRMILSLIPCQNKAWWQEHVDTCLFQRGSGLQTDIRAGEPSSSSQRVPRWGAEEWLCVSWIHLPQTQVLGQECGSGAQRHHHTGASQVTESAHLCF